MRAAELIGCQVHDTDGHPIGTVHDLHFQIEIGTDGNPVCYLDALECGGIGIAHRLGYGEHAMSGPWPFPALFRYLAQRSVIVPWASVSAVSRPSIHTTARPDQLKPARGTRS
jgi:hypothetical protein